MRRVPWVVTVTLACGLGAPVRVHGAAPPIRTDLAAEMRAADTVCVYRFVRNSARGDSIAGDSTARNAARWRPFDSVLMDTTWSRSFVSLLERSAFHERGRCERVYDSIDTAQNRVSLAGDHGRFIVYFESSARCAQLAWGPRSIGWFEFEPAVAREIMGLIDRAHSRESTPFRAATRRAEPAATGSEPRFGEYVYVEELPEALKKVPPSYPEDARKANVDGTVMVQALVGKDDRVKDTRIVRSIPLLDRAAIAAVEQWEFKPAMAKGAPVAVWVAIPVKFALH